jgi:APA family basic amino acid/polyamine antiporter
MKPTAKGTLTVSDAAKTLTRGIGPWQATALNVTFVVGAGVFITIPKMLDKLPGPYALCGWLAAGALILVDGLIWSELGATLPGSGGSYRYLLECYGRDRWGRLAAFLFIWQFLLSGPLELGSGLVAVAQFSTGLSPTFQKFDQAWTWQWVICKDPALSMSFGPGRLLGFLVGVGVIVLLYRNITTLGKLTVTVWLGVMATLGWILLEGWAHFQPDVAFDFSGRAATWPADFGWMLGPAMVLAIYSYLGYYNVCYIGDEVRDPGRTIPRAIVGSTLIVCILFAGVHLAMLGTVPWSEVSNKDDYSLPADFMGRIHGQWAVTLLTLLLIWCCFGSVFAGLLGYSRIPFGAAQQGHFFRVFGKIHATQRIPHVSLLLVGGLMLCWSFFDLDTIINGLIVTRILEQFVAQAIGVMLLRYHQPDRPRPFRMWLYPLPCLLALVGWLYLYVSAPWLWIGLGTGTLVLGIVVFFVWSYHTARWPFEKTKSTA